jgi:hypothetical protein
VGEAFRTLVAVQPGLVIAADAGDGSDVAYTLAVDGEGVDAPIRALPDLEGWQSQRLLPSGSCWCGLCPGHVWSSPS